MSIWDDAKSILGIVAPTIGTAIGGPLGGLAVSAVCKALGLDSSASEAQVAQAIKTATPEQLFAIKQAENEFATTMSQLQVDLAALPIQDKADARDREKTIRDKTPQVMGYCIVGSFVGIIVSVLFGWAKVDSVLAGTLIGYMSAKAEQVVAYFFGSSAGSDNKTQLLANSVQASAIPLLSRSASDGR